MSEGNKEDSKYNDNLSDKDEELIKNLKISINDKKYDESLKEDNKENKKEENFWESMHIDYIYL